MTATASDVGKMVHWVPPEHGHWAAVITKVTEDKVSLLVFPPEDVSAPFPTLADRVYDITGAEGGTWHWPEDDVDE